MIDHRENTSALRSSNIISMYSRAVHVAQLGQGVYHFRVHGQKLEQTEDNSELTLRLHNLQHQHLHYHWSLYALLLCFRFPRTTFL